MTYLLNGLKSLYSIKLPCLANFPTGKCWIPWRANFRPSTWLLLEVFRFRNKSSSRGSRFAPAFFHCPRGPRFLWRKFSALRDLGRRRISGTRHLYHNLIQYHYKGEKMNAGLYFKGHSDKHFGKLCSRLGNSRFVTKVFQYISV